MVIFLFGPDTYRSTQRLQELVEKFVTERDPQRLNTVVLHCGQVSDAAVMEQILAVPFLAEKRLIVLKQSVASGSDVLREELTKRIKEGRLPEENTYIFWEEALSTKKKTQKGLVAVLKKEKYTQEFSLLKGPALSEWIVQACKTYGKDITRGAAQYIVTAAQDMWQVHTVIEQSVAFTKDTHTITEEVVQQFLTEAVQDNIFPLIDAIVTKQVSQAMVLLEEQFAQGKEPNFVFSMVLRQFRLIAQVVDLSGRGEVFDQNTLSKILKIHPFAAQKTIQQAQRYSMKDIINVYNSLIKIDEDQKHGRQNMKKSLQLFVAQLS